MSTNLATNDLHTVEIPFHLHFRQAVRPPENWEEWLELGRTAVTLDQKLGLLHGAFNVEMGYIKTGDGTYRLGTYADRLQVFFEIADGWDDNYLLKSGGRYSDEPIYMVGYDRHGNCTKRRESEQRQLLARKAFDMLAMNFFRMPSIREDLYERSREEFEWLKKLVFGPLFAVVQDFFRTDKDTLFSRVTIRNLSRGRGERSPQEKHAISFLLKLANFLWVWEEPCASHFARSPEGQAEKKKEEQEIASMRAIVDGAKPWMIEILAHLGKLDVLDTWLRDLDEASLRTLEGIALRSELRKSHNQVSEDRTVSTIDEACYVGSPAGWLLKKHELAAREHARLTEIQTLEWQREAADRKLETLKT